VSIESVQKIDKKLVEQGSRDQLRAALVDSLNGFHVISLENLTLRARVLALENENRTLKGEKKSPSLGRPRKQD
jgi:hypothetical protein